MAEFLLPDVPATNLESGSKSSFPTVDDMTFHSASDKPLTASDPGCASSIAVAADELVKNLTEVAIERTPQAADPCKLPNYNVTLLDDGCKTTLADIRGGNSMVIDFWTTKCPRCPDALCNLNLKAGKAKKAGKSSVYLSCALSQGEGHEVAADLVSEGLEHLTHVFIEFEMKEKVKEFFGFKSVPFFVVIDKNGTIVGKGEPKSFNYAALLASCEESAACSSVSPSSSSTSEEQENKSPSPSNQTHAPTNTVTTEAATEGKNVAKVAVAEVPPAPSRPVFVLDEDF